MAWIACKADGVACVLRLASRADGLDRLYCVNAVVGPESYFVSAYRAPPGGKSGNRLKTEYPSFS